jgi:hypothetical protein
VERIEEMRNAPHILIGKIKGKRQMDNLGVDGGNIKVDFKTSVKILAGFIWPRIVFSGFCEDGNENLIP